MSPDKKDEISELIAGQVRELIKLVNESDIAELRIERGDLKLHIAKGQHKDAFQSEIEDDSESSAAIEPPDESALVLAPLVGRFYRARPGKKPLVNPGDAIARGQAVCIVESMKILNEIQSELDGQLDEILCEDGQAVEYGQPLFRVRPCPPATSS